MLFQDMLKTKSDLELLGNGEGIWRKKGIVLIDDDADFCALMRAICQPLKHPIDTFGSLGEMNSFAMLKEYDIAIIDFYLKSFCGLEIAEYVEVFFSELPVVLISADSVVKSPGNKQWPYCIKKFVCKIQGPITILRETVKQVEKKHYYDGIKNRGSERAFAREQGAGNGEELSFDGFVR